MKEIMVTNEVQVQIRKLKQEYPKIAQQTQTRYIDVQLDGTTAYVTILTIAPEGLVTDEYLKSGEKRVFDALTKMGVKSIDLVIKIVPVEIKEYKAIQTK
jgi:CMP-2-keto-3-deoxyoctulosonic acid synthetase